MIERDSKGYSRHATKHLIFHSLKYTEHLHICLFFCFPFLCMHLVLQWTHFEEVNYILHLLYFMINPSQPHFIGRQGGLMVNWEILFQSHLLFSWIPPSCEATETATCVFTINDKASLSLSISVYWPYSPQRLCVYVQGLCKHMYVGLETLPLVNVTQPRGKETFPVFLPRFSRTLMTMESLEACFCPQRLYWTRNYCILIGWTQCCNSIEAGL